LNEWVFYSVEIPKQIALARETRNERRRNENAKHIMD
jgi:hypothetical protein